MAIGTDGRASAEGGIEYGGPQVADRADSFVSRAQLRHTNETRAHLLWRTAIHVAIGGQDRCRTEPGADEPAPWAASVRRLSILQELLHGPRQLSRSVGGITCSETSCGAPGAPHPHRMQRIGPSLTAAALSSGTRMRTGPKRRAFPWCRRYQPRYSTRSSRASDLICSPL